MIATFSVEDVKNILEQGMKVGIVGFTFIKRNGEVRHAFGTRLPSLVKEHTVGGQGPQGVISFWDVEAAGWRSVRPSTITQIDFK